MKDCTGCTFLHKQELPKELEDINPFTCRINPPVIVVSETIVDLDKTSLLPETFFPTAIGRCGKFEEN